MQEIIAFIIRTIQSFIDTCVNNELLAWVLVLFILAIVFGIFSTFWKK